MIGVVCLNKSALGLRDSWRSKGLQRGCLSAICNGAERERLVGKQNPTTIPFTFIRAVYGKPAERQKIKGWDWQFTESREGGNW